jgi:hypothetical protein
VAAPVLNDTCGVQTHRAVADRSATHAEQLSNPHVRDDDIVSGYAVENKRRKSAESPID